MGELFIYGGEEYLVKDRLVLRGMTYYRVLMHRETGAKLYLMCYPGDC